MVEPPGRPDAFAIFIGQVSEPPVPFEVWVNGGDQPRGLGAIAKSLSMDMRSEDRAWLKLKLDALAKTRDERPLQVAFPPDGALHWKPGIVAAFAEIVRHRCDELRLFENLERAPTPMLDAVLFHKEPKSGALGTLSWTVDVLNPATGDDFVLGLKELQLPDGTRRPYSIWLSGDYPRVLDGLCKLLSIDMRVVDASWIGLKLKKLLNFGEMNGSFWAPVPGAERSQSYPSTVAYLAALILHRFKTLALVDDDGRAIAGGGILAAPTVAAAVAGTVQMSSADRTPLKGALCTECGSFAVARVAGCQHCTACGWTGQCG
jgi:ribonucleoside-diphosphate reductase alpha chain